MLKIIAVANGGQEYTAIIRKWPNGTMKDGDWYVSSIDGIKLKGGIKTLDEAVDYCVGILPYVFGVPS